MIIEVTIKETSKGSFRLAFNGSVLGDSRGYDKAGAIAEARKYEGRTDGNWVNGEWIEVVDTYKVCV